MMNESNQKNPVKSPAERAENIEGQWVMVFNVLTKQGKEEQKRSYKLNKNQIVIGSALSSDIRIQQNSVSNVHAVVEVDAQGVARIYDMASETGVFINEKKVVSEEIRGGDEIRIGFATITFKRQSVAEAQAQLPKPMVRSSGERKLFLNEQEDFRPLILEDERDVIQIFDYPISSEHAIQVVMYWGEVILDVKHFSGPEPIVIGEGDKADFLVPGVQDFQLLTHDGTGYSLQILPAMTGVIRSGKQVLSLAELSKAREASKSFHLKNSDQAKIQIREITFFVNYSAQPPSLRRQKVLERDPFYTRIWFSSLALTTAFVLLIAKMEKPAPLTVDELPPRVATMIFQPPKELPKPIPVPVEKKVPEPPVEKKVAEVAPPKPKRLPPAPKPVPKIPKPKAVVQHKLPTEVKHTANKPKAPVNISKAETRPAPGNQGSGERHAGAEGAAGKPESKLPSKAPQTAAKGTPSSTNAQKTPAVGEGNVESFFNGIDGSISKKMAASSAGANAAAENLRGHGAFSTSGKGGLGEIGNGSGGGGTSMSVSGLGTKGLGDGAAGKGLGRIGEGGDLSGTARGRPSIEVGNTNDTVIMGGLDKDLIDQIIRKHMDQIRHCYEQEANVSKGNLRGRVMMRFVIASSGRVSQAGVQSTSLQNANVERCLIGTMQRIIFPEPQGGGEVEVSYPFLFAPAFSGK